MAFDRGGNDGTRRRTLTEEMVFMRTKCNRLDLIKNLNLWGNDLHNINVLRFMPNLEVLSLSVNSVSTLADLKHLSKLSELYLRKNEISDLSEVQHLVNLRHLRVLWLNDNPCAKLPHYRQYVLHHLPSLAKLDSQDVTDDERRRAQRPLTPDVPTRLDAQDGHLVDDLEQADCDGAADAGGGAPVDTWGQNGYHRGGTAGIRNRADQGMRHSLDRSRIGELRQEEDFNPPAAAVAHGRRFSQSGDLQPYASRGIQQQQHLSATANNCDVDEYDRRPAAAATNNGGRRCQQEPSASQFYGGGERSFRNDRCPEDNSPDMTPRGEVIEHSPYMDRGYGHHMGDERGGGWQDHRGADTYAAWQESPPRRGDPGVARLSDGYSSMQLQHHQFQHEQPNLRRSTSSKHSATPDGTEGVVIAPTGGTSGGSPPGCQETAGRADNILCAVLALIKELDRQGLELVRRAIEQRQGEL